MLMHPCPLPLCLGCARGAAARAGRPHRPAARWRRHPRGLCSGALTLHQWWTRAAAAQHGQVSPATTAGTAPRCALLVSHAGVTCCTAVQLRAALLARAFRRRRTAPTLRVDRGPCCVLTKGPGGKLKAVAGLTAGGRSRPLHTSVLSQQCEGVCYYNLQLRACSNRVGGRLVGVPCTWKRTWREFGWGFDVPCPHNEFVCFASAAPAVACREGCVPLLA